MGIFSVALPSGLTLHGCTFHTKNGERWVGLPAQRFGKGDGTTSYAPGVEFTDRTAADKFREMVLEAIDDARLVVGGAQ
jgi:hypothetical protein